MAKPYKAPKAIAGHPAVSECEDAKANGAPDYRHDIILRDGWCWKRGRNAGGRSLLCRTVAEFHLADPVECSATKAEG